MSATRPHALFSLSHRARVSLSLRSLSRSLSLTLSLSHDSEQSDRADTVAQIPATTPTRPTTTHAARSPRCAPGSSFQAKAQGKRKAVAEAVVAPMTEPKQKRRLCAAAATVTTTASWTTRPSILRGWMMRAWSGTRRAKSTAWGVWEAERCMQRWRGAERDEGEKGGVAERSVCVCVCVRVRGHVRIEIQSTAAANWQQTHPYNDCKHTVLLSLAHFRRW